MSPIYVNDIFDELSEENKRLLNELMFANKCLNSLNKFKTFIDSVFDKLNTNLDSNERIKYEEINKEIEESLNERPIIRNSKSVNKFICFLIVCGKQFKTSNHLYNHLKTEHNFEANPTEIDNKLDESNDNSLDLNENEFKNINKQTIDDSSDKTKAFVCDFNGCGKEFIKKYRLSDHMKCHTKPYICDYEGCHYRSGKHSDLKRHENIHKRVTPYKCHICNKGFAHNSGLTQHIRTLHKDEQDTLDNFKINQVFVCDFIGCGKEYIKRRRFTEHKKSHNNPFNCDYEGCHYQTFRKCNFNKHINIHKGITYKCHICGKGYHNNNTLKNHIKAIHENPEQPLVCGIDNCDKAFKNEVRLNAHKYIYHLTEKRFSCDYPNCEFRTSIKFHLETHKTKHTKERPFSCTFEGCLKTFKLQNTRNEHIKTHLITDRKFKCLVNGCDKGFTTERNLKIHQMNSHSGVRYQCDWPGCEFETNFPSSIRIHKVVHCPEKFVCDWPQCGKRFKSKDRLELHIRMHKKDKRYACHWPGCNYRCVFNGNLSKHMKIHKK